MLCLVAQLCTILCNPMNCNPPGFSVHGDSLGKNTGVGCHVFLQGKTGSLVPWYQLSILEPRGQGAPSLCPFSAPLPLPLQVLPDTLLVVIGKGGGVSSLLLPPTHPHMASPSREKASQSGLVRILTLTGVLARVRALRRPKLLRF